MGMDEAIWGQCAEDEWKRKPRTPRNTNTQGIGEGRQAEATKMLTEGEAKIRSSTKPRGKIFKKELLNNIKCGREVR